MTLPSKISPCPIIDAIFEIRFTANTHPNAVFGLIYKVLEKDFPRAETLPILELPEVVRANDPALHYKPHYKLPARGFVLQLGPNVLSISSFPEYSGWNDLFNKITDVLDKIENIGFVNEISRMGIRYINFFEDNIFKHINLRININDSPISYTNTVVRTEISQADFLSTLQIANNVKNNGKIGSIIDIDTYKETALDDFFSRKEALINDGHLKEKELFFSLLNADFLQTLKPEY
jgi:uncharacterized protein (TIGR04255 family)